MNSISPVSDRDFAGRLRRFWSDLKKSIAGNHKEDYTSGPIGRAVFLLAVPMVLEMAMESIFAVADIFYVSTLGPEAVAVVGITEAVLTLVYAVAIGLSMGTTAMVARRIGEKKRRDASIVAGQTLWVGLAVSLLIGIPGVIYARDILVLIGAEPAVVEQGVGYTAVMLGGSASIVFIFLINAIFRGAGDAAVAMRALWLANGINLVLDPCLIFGLGPFPELGVTGAAIATTIGRGTGVLYQLYHLFGVRGRINLSLKRLAIVPGVIARLARVSMGGVFQFFIATSSWIALMKIMAAYGSAAIAGYTIAIRVIEFTILPAWGMGNAASTLVGQNLGAGKPERAERSVWTAAKYNFVILVLVAVVFIVFAEGILRLFSDDPDVIRYGVDCLRYISYGYGFYAVGMILVQSFNGAGDTDTPTVLNAICFWLLQIPLAYFLAVTWDYGPLGVFIAIMVCESLLAVLGVIQFRRGRWKHRVL